MADTASIVESGQVTSASPEGLSNAEAERRRAVYGANETEEQSRPAWQAFLAKFFAPVPWLLEAAILLQLALGKFVEAALIGGLLIFNTTLSFIQEGRASAALAALKKRLAPTALVRRDGAWNRVPAAVLVPGDIIQLALGALVPADARIVSGAVMVDQSMLTGESVPVDAGSGDTIYAGSLIRRGAAIAEVTATGAKTYFGKTAELVRVAHAASTEQAAVFAVTRNLAIVNGSITALIVIYAVVGGLPNGEVVRLALTALLGTIPVALPATFTLSAALGAQTLAARSVLLTRLSAAHEAAAMDVLCADKTGTLTQNALEVVDIVPLPGFDRSRVLALAARASAEADQDPIDTAIRNAARTEHALADERLVQFVPFDPARKISEARVIDRGGVEWRIVKGAFEIVATMAQMPTDAQNRVDDLAARGHRVIAVAAGSTTLRLAGLVAISDPPRDDSAPLIAELHAMGVRTIMVTGDSAVTASAIAKKIGLEGAACHADQMPDAVRADQFGIFARVLPEQKFRLVQALQKGGHVVGMCGDGTNDAPALRQAQIGIAVSSATDVAKAAAGMVLTEPGLSGIVAAVREGRAGFRRLTNYTLNMLVKKIEIVLFLAIGLLLTGQAVLTPALMVLLFITNDFLSMSLTTDRVSGSAKPNKWNMRGITAAAVIFGLCKLAFSAAILAVGAFAIGLDAVTLQTLAFVALVFGNQALLYVLRERHRMWSSRPGNWVIASSVVDTGLATALALSGTLMAPLALRDWLAVFIAAVGFALLLDGIKRLVLARFPVD
jgi:H+-transporting ATPase